MSEQLQHPALRDWLGRATRDLVPEARSAIRAEIEAHFLDTFEESLAAGADEAEAAEEALRRLGDPRRAQRAYRRQFPTRREYLGAKRLLARARHRPPALGTAVIQTMTIALIGECYFGRGEVFSPMGLIALAGFFMATTTYFHLRLKWLRTSRAMAVRLMKREMIFNWIVICGAIVLWTATRSSSRHDLYSGAVGLGIFTLFNAIGYLSRFQAWDQVQKLRKTREPENPAAME